ncbi:unnamed protein product [Blepharisma stoltei]|uniref:Translation elongation factor EF1B beta/delta subunit guanine nucleotide exchange domain-containing protein n=1 Tax=Blepharisma stoltei TaxID=1481888 RepID=A0AAU9K388_9CILI|nr:unnamed protein product [Blepharisma stoltei]
MALTASEPQRLEEALQANLYLTGDHPTHTDAKVFGELSGTSFDKAAFPNLWAWFQFISQFAPEITQQWPAPVQQAPAHVEAAPEQKAAEGAEEDDVDLFADDPSVEEEAKKLAEEKAKGKKEEPVGRSTVVFDVKPTTSTVDLDALAARIINEVQFPGLKWGAEFKKQPVAFGIFKLMVGCVMEDTVETEAIVEQIMEMTGQMNVEEEDEEGNGTGVWNTVEDNLVQSVDIANFQKL